MIGLRSRLKRIVQRATQRAGYEIVRSGPQWGRLDYERIRPLAMYSPWNKDELFLDTYDRIRGYTFVDMYRCYELWTLVEQTHTLTGSLIEVGVWRGGTGALIARSASLCGIQDTVYLCDTFTGIVKAGPRDPVFTDGDLGDTSVQIVEQLIYEQFKLSNVTIIAGIFPDQAADCLADATFRLCHIDVDVYQSAKDITDWLWPRLVVSGVIIYDDYGFQGCSGITSCVDEQRGLADRLIIHNLNGHALIIKLKEVD
jgi:O-methyltransferase